MVITKTWRPATIGLVKCSMTWETLQGLWILYKEQQTWNQIFLVITKTRRPATICLVKCSMTCETLKELWILYKEQQT